MGRVIPFRPRDHFAPAKPSGAATIAAGLILGLMLSGLIWWALVWRGT